MSDNPSAPHPDADKTPGQRIEERYAGKQFVGPGIWWEKPAIPEGNLPQEFGREELIALPAGQSYWDMPMVARTDPFFNQEAAYWERAGKAAIAKDTPKSPTGKLCRLLAKLKIAISLLPKVEATAIITTKLI